MCMKFKTSEVSETSEVSVFISLPRSQAVQRTPSEEPGNEYVLVWEQVKNRRTDIPVCSSL